MKSRKLGIGLLLLLAFVFTTGTFAYWASSISVTEDTAVGTVTIGSGGTAETAVTVGDVTNAGTLVPYGRAETGDVEYVLLTFSVSYDETTDLLGGEGTGTLSATISNKAINTNTGLASYVITEVQVGGTTPTVTDGGTGYSLDGTPATSIIVDGDDVNVYVLVELGEPANASDYNAIATYNITFTVTFDVTHS